MADVAERYEHKIQIFCSGIDPYTLDMFKCNDCLPHSVTYFDVVEYCINNDSSYTLQSFKAYKALDAYNFYISGWVKKIACKKHAGGYIVITNVHHSQRLKEKLLHCWISVDTNGIILCGHCSCMGGLGEVCSHVGATLFFLEAWGRKSKEHNVTVNLYRS